MTTGRINQVAIIQSNGDAKKKERNVDKRRHQNQLPHRRTTLNCTMTGRNPDNVHFIEIAATKEPSIAELGNERTRRTTTNERNRAHNTGLAEPFHRSNFSDSEARQTPHHGRDQRQAIATSRRNDRHASNDAAPSQTSPVKRRNAT